MNEDGGNKSEQYRLRMTLKSQKLSELHFLCIPAKRKQPIEGIFVTLV